MFSLTTVLDHEVTLLHFNRQHLHFNFQPHHYSLARGSFWWIIASHFDQIRYCCGVHGNFVTALYSVSVTHWFVNVVNNIDHCVFLVYFVISNHQFHSLWGYLLFRFVLYPFCHRESSSVVEHSLSCKLYLNLIQGDIQSI